MTSLTIRRPLGRTAVRHDPVTIALHWITAFLVLAQFASAHVWDLLEKGTPLRIDLIMMHLAFGILLAVTMVLRIGWRLLKRDRLPSAVHGLQKLASSAVHMVLYALLAGQVAVGLMFSWSTGKPLPFFDLFAIPVPVFIDPSFRPLLAALHNDIGWGIIAVAGLHAVAALMHHYAFGDEVLNRMLPGSPKGILGSASGSRK